MKKWTLVLLGLGSLFAAMPATGIDPDCSTDVIGPAGVDALDVTAVIESLGSSLAFVDFNGDGEVGGLDLTMVLDNLGPCPCIGDMDSDGDVDSDDINEAIKDAGSDCRGDLTGDGFVDEDDRAIALASVWVTISEEDPNADVNDDGLINLTDVTAIADEINTRCLADTDWDGDVDQVDLLFIAAGGMCP